MIPVLAVAILYDPARPVGQQTFDGGLIRLLQMLLRLFLPVTAAVLALYLCIVPFFFWRPLKTARCWIIYNAMLFAVMALLVGVTSYAGRHRRHAAALAAPGHHRRGGADGIVSIYALAAISYRTLQEGLYAQPRDLCRLEPDQHRPPSVPADQADRQGQFELVEGSASDLWHRCTALRCMEHDRRVRAALPF
ncbi:MAG: hypothetical protein U0X20_07290 [Caldilineaceae bacterium]